VGQWAPKEEGGVTLVFSGEDFTTRLMNDMDPPLLDLVKTKVNSFIKWDLVRFLRENPNTADTAENIAKYVGRNATTVEPELRELVDSQIMEVKQVDGMPVYSLSTDAGTRELLDRFITACEDRHFRVKVIYHIVRGMR
ncbi:MAG: hypothetical protein PVF77_10010, partial [Anaerolineae bacterium]